jgi:hypothetical protein
MPGFDEIRYSREATVSAFCDYYRFLVDLYMEDSDIIEPPEGGWPAHFVVISAAVWEVG